MAYPLPDYVVCPRCHASLDEAPSEVICTGCGTRYPRLSTVHFAAAPGDAEKARQQAIYEGAARSGLALPYRDVDAYRAFCTTTTDLIRRAGVHGAQFKALKTRELLDRLAPRPGDRVLDVGSGDGALLALLALRWRVYGVGVDIAAAAVERALRVNPWGHELYQADAEELPFSDTTFDGVVSMDVLEHLPHPDECLREAGRVLRPGGWALFYAVSQRDRYTWHWVQRELTGDRVGVDSGAGHRWEDFIRPDQAREWMEAAGFAEVRITPFHALASLMMDERFPSVFMRLIDRPWLLRLVLRLAETIDAPLVAREYCNGFYIQGRMPH